MIVTTELINALHFRRGIQNMQVSNMEWELPIPALPLTSKRHSLPTTNDIGRRLSKRKRRPQVSIPKSPDEPATLVTAQKEIARQSFIETGEYNSLDVRRDWTIVQKAWWDAILLMHEDPSVVRIALEMRIMGSSEIILAPQRGNVLGTCAIEILSTLNTPPDDWNAFCQKLANKWVSYKDRSTGKPLHARPHWCKQWSFLSLPDGHGRWLTAPEWMRNVAYKHEIPEFLGVLKRIGETSGFTMDDLRARFGNELLESVFWTGADFPHGVKTDKEGVNKFKNWFKTVFS
jgi:hypothetical protein